VISGHGLHSGGFCRVRLHREAGPLRFRRGRSLIPATLSAVADTRRATTLAADGARVALVEHLLAALRILGFFGGVLVEADADELPILDGSALPWLEAAQGLGPPPAPPPVLAFPEAVTYQEGDALLQLEPGGSGLRAEVDFPHASIGHQVWEGDEARYRELADARTFGFLHEVAALHRAGLAQHAGLENAIVFGDDGPLTPLRHPDEIVRHKALDALGDAVLLGRPLAGRLTVVRGSHRHHVAFFSRLEALAEGRS
jgi:UDP-3-O-[3-hydroxymyristoyl] N-acetylglucosamine deacetylase